MENYIFNFVNVFSLFCYYLPLEYELPFIWTNLTTHHPRMIYAKFGWNWFSGSGEEDEKREKFMTTKQRRWTNCDQESSFESSAQVS